VSNLFAANTAKRLEGWYHGIPLVLSDRGFFIL
jgi:hypothetical protein